MNVYRNVRPYVVKHRVFYFRWVLLSLIQRGKQMTVRQGDLTGFDDAEVLDVEETEDTEENESNAR